MSKRKLNFRSSWDDGNILDLRLADYLHGCHLPAIFYLPNCTGLSTDSIKKLSQEFEIGGHTVTHPQDLKILDDEKLASEILDNKIWLENIIWKRVNKFCYPRGRFDNRVIEAVKNAGYTEARTTVVLKNKIDDPFATPTSVHVFSGRTEYNGKTWIEVAMYEALKASVERGIFHVWGHSLEIEKNEEWPRLKRFFEWVDDNFEIKSV